jgi:hypothetical protein
MNAALVAVVTLTMSASLAAQWLDHPTPGIPRTADGKPNLAAPAPRTADGKPDLSGLWNKMSPKYSRNIAADLKSRRHSALGAGPGRTAEGGSRPAVHERSLRSARAWLRDVGR